MRLRISAALLGASTALGVTVYGNQAAATTSATAVTTGTLPSPTQDITLVPPNPPGNVTKNLPISLPVAVPANSSGKLVGGNFMGYSIELSVATQFLGDDPAHLQVPFLNYLASQLVRAKSPLLVRVGGNTQDFSSIDPAQNVSMIKSVPAGQPNTYTGTPDVSIGPNLLYTMSNISALVGNINWAFGLEMITLNADGNALTVAEYASSILGPNLYTLEIGNEPDLYANHDQRPQNYSIPNYIAEFGQELLSINGSSAVPKKIFNGPGVCCFWDAQDIFNQGYLAAYSSSMNLISVQHYPSDNCNAVGKTNGTAVIPQDVFYQYLGHQYVTSLTSPYNATYATGVQYGIDTVVMMETNTASCGGFPGISDSFGAALWAVDYGLSLAALGFTHSLFHVSGRSVYYNAFQPPPTNMSLTEGWITGPVYYSAILLAETFGSGGQAVDLATGIDYAPAYAIFDGNGVPSRAVFMNYVTDATGASDYTIDLSVPAAPASVTVKYLVAPSTAEHYNITFAGQSWGGDNADGSPTGDEQVVTITCQTSPPSCPIPVMAPSVALVFLTTEAATDAAVPVSATSTYATTAATKLYGTATVASLVLETSNGAGGAQQVFGYSGTGSGKSTSDGVRFGPARSIATLVLAFIFVLAL